MKYNFFLIFLIMIGASSIVLCQEGFNHPELEWRTIETPHFLVHFHNGAERTAHEVAKIAESIYGPVTTMYGHVPDQRVSFIICDYDDNSNGAAYFYENRIEIWAPAMDYELRGIHPWLWNVVTHEFTHIIQIQTSMKFGRKVPGIYFQWLGYEKERRPDVLYGYPNVIVSYPLSGFLVPIWFAEGTAQYNNPNLDYDYWDSHRDMILRMYMIDGNPLSWDEMGVFGKNSLGNESAYNAGFSLVEYIGKKYGDDKLQEISRQLAATFRLTIDGAIEKVLGKTGEQLYEEWKADKTAKYKKLADSLSPGLIEGEVIENDGFGNFYPVFSPDGSKIAYVSEKGEDYLRFSSIYLYDRQTKISKLIVEQVRSSLSFSPDGRYLYYAKETYDNPNRSKFSDLHRYDIIDKEEKRLTYGLRAFNPKLSSDGKKLVFAFGSDGTLNIGLCDTDGKNILRLTNFQNGEQVYSPVWSVDGKIIACGYSKGHNQSIALIDTDGANFQTLQHTGECRDPFFSSDSTLYYSWDRGGIYNIYRHDIRTGNDQQITNVLGGAFLPTLDSTGNIAYVSYTSSGYKIAALQRDSISYKMSSTNLPFQVEAVKVGGTDNSFLLAGKDQVPSENNIFNQPKPYKYVFTSLSLFPIIRFDNYTESSDALDMVKAGLYVNSSEVLNKMNIFGGAAINKKFERDLFLVFNYEGRIPVLYELGLGPGISLGLYNITRKRDISFDLYIDRPQTFNTEVTYNLFEFDFSISMNIIPQYMNLGLSYSLSRFSQDFGSWLHPRYNVIPSTRSTYFIGNAFSAQLKFDGILPRLDKAINPIGRSVSLKYIYELNKFNPTDSAKYENGFRVPVYTNYNISRVELNWNEHIELSFPKHTISFTLSAAGILGDSVDEFFDYYAGGFIGMRGYPFYSIGGNKSLTLNATYRFPIATELNIRIFQLYFKKLYASVFCDIGDGWTHSVPSVNHWKRDVGFELRLESYSYYTLPTRIFFSGAYGLDKFSRIVRMINTETITYGQEWRFYLGILFDFELNDIIPHQRMR